MNSRAGQIEKISFAALYFIAFTKRMRASQISILELDEMAVHLASKVEALTLFGTTFMNKKVPLLVPNVVICTENVVTHALPNLSEEKKEEEKREGKEGRFAFFLWTS